MPITPLHSMSHPAVLFAGQGSEWQSIIASATQTTATAQRLQEVLSQARTLIAPVARTVSSSGPGAAERLKQLIGGEADRELGDVLPAVSIPGIVLGQIAAIEQLRDLGIDIDERAGHSQGSLGALAVDKPAEALALAILMGTASTAVNGTDPRSQMLSVRGLERSFVTEHLHGTAAIAVVNGRRHFALSGSPEDLAATRTAIEEAVKSFNDELDKRTIGGDELSPRFDELPVALPFHNPVLAPAAERTAALAQKCGLDVDEARAQAEAILVTEHDWPATLDALSSEHLIVLDRALTNLTRRVVEGTGVTVISAATPRELDALATPGTELPEALNYADFAPRTIELPNGRTYTQTRFSDLTGLSPIMLGGMTPTSADGEIVAAAANAGHWTEMAGGGMYSEEVFRAHLATMEQHLRPGRTAQFNTMFFDRFLWNLHFGQARIVPKARAAGAPFNGVCISAGIPEVEEAGELLDRLHADGFPFISFKPGTAKQIRDVLAIATAYPEDRIIMQVEDGHAGGHHSWVNLDDMLLETYGEIRQHPTVYLAVGGGIASPDRATSYLTGEWAKKHAMPAMPVDAVFLGTVAMATKEAKATNSVKDLLVNTEGISPSKNGGWVGRGTGANGVASSQSHLLADIHDLDNSFAAASRLITALSIDEYATHREEIIAALDKTCKPYFGDVESMTYAEWLERFVELAHPFVDPSWDDRFLDLLHRVEARLNPADHGQIETLFTSGEDVHDGPAAVAKLLKAYPAARATKVSARDAAWWISLHYKHVKPMPWVPAIDGDLKSWFGKDTLWQAQDERYTADQVRIIPGPVAVAGITKKNEPVADLLTRFEQATTDALLKQGSTPQKAFSRLNSAADAAAFLRSAPSLLWHGHLMANPAYEMDENAFDLRQDADGNWNIVITADSYWDDLPEEHRPFYVREVTVPVDLPEDVATGGSPVVSEERLPDSVFALLEGLAGVGSTAEQGDEITDMPSVDSGYSFHFPASLLSAHSAVTCGKSAANKAGTPDVLVGPCWPAIYAALGSGRLMDGYPVIEGLLNAVHLDHVIDVRVPLEQLADGRQIDVTSSCTAVEESASGRIVTVELELTDHASGDIVATQMHRFAIRGRATGTAAPKPAPEWGGGKSATKVVATPRSFVDRATVTAPQDMTPFALVSGDYNPIHTSYNAAQLVNLDAPLVHGMWLSAAAQQVAGRHGRVVGWTYSMYGMVQLGDDIEITVERVGRKGIHQALEVTCRIDGEVVSRGQALLAAPTTAYVYPGQGIQTEGMGTGDRQASPAAREAWRRADAHTRENLGFSIQKIIDENPTELTVRGTTFRHPKGVLHLTQFTQVALAVVAYAQTERLRAENTLAPTSYFAGHSLGEYTALASLANIFDLEGVIDIVYSRGSAMGSLVPRDEEGNSEYAMAALRPNMAGIDADNVDAWVAEVAETTGEFLEIVNYNIRGQQYSVAGTKKGLKALVDKANAIAPRAAVMVPGIDVPFHSRVLREGVPAFAEKLDELLPQELDLDALVGRYIPNLVARPFELTQDFVDAVAPLAPSGKLDGLRVEDLSEHALARLLLIELLSWQFASPVRWIETQELLFGKVEQIIEVGLASSPTLTNLAERSLAVAGIPEGTIRVLNVERDQEQVMLADVSEAPTAETPAAETVDAEPAEPAVETTTEPVAAPTPAPAAAVPNDAPELSFGAAEAIMVLFAFQNKIRVDQITDSDTVEELTNGVSSRRNQLLMDMSAELGVPAIDGAADADVAALREKVATAAPGYSAFGPVLSEAVGTRLRQLLGAAGLKPAAVAEYVTGTWGLPESWVAHVEAEILLGSRDEDSVRGGSLNTVPSSATSKSAAHELIDAAVQGVANAHGASVSKDTAAGGASGGVVDSAALEAYAETVTGENGVLATVARQVLTQLGHVAEPAEATAPDTEVIEAVEAELGSGWLKSVTPSFDAAHAVLFDDAWAIARERLARVALGEIDADDERAQPAAFQGAGATVAEQARWWARSGNTAVDSAYFEQIAAAAESTEHGAYAGDVALVTGAAPGSIAAALVERLLAGGATVIMTASRVTQSRKEFARRLYAEHGRQESALWLVPANLTSFRDVDSLVEWIGSEQRESVGNEVKILKPALTPTLAFPFAAPSVSGSLADAGSSTESQARLLLWSVERLIGGLSDLAVKAPSPTRCHVVLPGSPNRGTFGGDGAYGEVKAALDAILAKWNVEAGWPAGVTLAQAKIGWVAGTHLMGGNDVLVPAAQKAGIHVWSPEEISSELLDLASAESRARATERPIEADLTGGLEGFSLTSLEVEKPAAQSAAEGAAKDTTARIKALPSPARPVQPQLAEELGDITTDLDDMVVIAGIGEVSSWGSGRTRFEAEYGLQRDGSAELTAAGVIELAWMTGLIAWREEPAPGWFVGETDEQIAEEDIYERFRDEVVARAGVRELTDKYHLVDRGSIDLTTVFLDRDITFTVDSEATARDIAEADPEFTSIREADGEWEVTRRKGATAKVPRKATLTRTVAAQMPDNFDAARWGIPDHMLDSLDRMAVWNLVTAVDAFIQAGFSPAELLQSIHPGQVSTTQGTGIGGMESLHKVFVSRFLGEDRPSDILQEALPNVIAAHTMQSLVGGYGSMIHPIGACATAAVSIEEGVDKIALGKADVVVAGGIDDVQVESLQGFGDMNATAETAAMTAKGIDKRFISRANDRRRGGFLEGEGGGTVLLVRGSLAQELGLPVLAVVAHAASYGDGAHTSIPAPGLGALGAGRGRENSRLARSLRGLSLTPNDVSVLSKHDTSTNANDPNESELHSILWPAIGRDADQPMFVISQKTLTGHSKAGAALFQTGGIIDVFRTGRIPANVSLDCVDPLIAPKAKNLVWLRSPLDLAAAGRSVKAAALTSLGFGHVGALIVYAHPGVFEEAIKQQRGTDAAAAWRERAEQRLAAGHARFEAGMLGRAPLFEVIDGRRMPHADTKVMIDGYGLVDADKAAEISMLLDADARLGATGEFPSA
ncbi:type I polyketide synthase [Corynebacterium singulare]|uniref:type I polyketide synthase n=1 Tax=Corynebacterium singulare TaxID=161899 RepID=UPI0011A3EDC2|nr:type I polyketide synthase [Corynebacterium singulare]